MPLTSNRLPNPHIAWRRAADEAMIAAIFGESEFTPGDAAPASVACAHPAAEALQMHGRGRRSLLPFKRAA